LTEVTKYECEVTKCESEVFPSFKLEILIKIRAVNRINNYKKIIF